MDTTPPFASGPLPAYRARIAAGELAPDPSQNLAAERLQELFGSIHGLTREFYARHGDVAVAASRLWPGMAAGLIVALTALERFFVPQGSDRPDREEMLGTIIDIWSRGILTS